MFPAPELTPDFAGGEVVAVHVDVGHAGADRVDQLVELSGGDALTRGSDHLGRRDGAGHLAGLRRREDQEFERASGGAELRPRQIIDL